jgi:hypothetical protein
MKYLVSIYVFCVVLVSGTLSAQCIGNARGVCSDANPANCELTRVRVGDVLDTFTDVHEGRTSYAQYPVRFVHDGGGSVFTVSLQTTGKDSGTSITQAECEGRVTAFFTESGEKDIKVIVNQQGQFSKSEISYNSFKVIYDKKAPVVTVSRVLIATEEGDGQLYSAGTTYYTSSEIYVRARVSDIPVLSQFPDETVLRVSGAPSGFSKWYGPINDAGQFQVPLGLENEPEGEYLLNLVGGDAGIDGKFDDGSPGNISDGQPIKVVKDFTQPVMKSLELIRQSNSSTSEVVPLPSVYISDEVVRIRAVFSEKLKVPPVLMIEQHAFTGIESDTYKATYDVNLFNENSSIVEYMFAPIVRVGSNSILRFKFMDNGVDIAGNPVNLDDGILLELKNLLREKGLTQIDLGVVEDALRVDLSKPYVSDIYPANGAKINFQLRNLSSTIIDPWLYKDPVTGSTVRLGVGSGISTEDSNIKLSLEVPYSGSLNPRVFDENNQVGGSFRFVHYQDSLVPNVSDERGDVVKMLMELELSNGIPTALLNDGSCDGIYKVEVLAVDKIGNVQNDFIGSTESYFLMDSAPPDLNVELANGEPVSHEIKVVNGQFSLSGTVRDKIFRAPWIQYKGAAGVDRIEYSVTYENIEGQMVVSAEGLQNPILHGDKAYLASISDASKNPLVSLTRPMQPQYSDIEMEERKWSISAKLPDIENVISSSDPSANYWVIIRAYDQAGNVNARRIRLKLEWGVDSQIKISAPELCEPIDKTFVEEVVVHFKWKAVPGAKDYIIYSSELETALTSNQISVPASRQVTWLVRPTSADGSEIKHFRILTRKGLYRWWVTARDDYGNEGESSPVWSFTRGQDGVIPEPPEVTVVNPKIYIGQPVVFRVGTRNTHPVFLVMDYGDGLTNGQAGLIDYHVYNDVGQYSVKSHFYNNYGEKSQITTIVVNVEDSITESQLNSSYELGVSEVLNNPSNYDLVSKESISKELVDAFHQGEQAVISEPAKYGLFSSNGFDSQKINDLTPGWHLITGVSVSIAELFQSCPNVERVFFYDKDFWRVQSRYESSPLNKLSKLEELEYSKSYWLFVSHLTNLKVSSVDNILAIQYDMGEFNPDFTPKVDVLIGIGKNEYKRMDTVVGQVKPLPSSIGNNIYVELPEDLPKDTELNIKVETAIGTVKTYSIIEGYAH